MIKIQLGEKRDIILRVTRGLADGPIEPTACAFRILDSKGNLLADWSHATWDAPASLITGTFDSSLRGLSAPGNYSVEFRLDIGNERYLKPVTVQVRRPK